MIKAFWMLTSSTPIPQEVSLSGCTLTGRWKFFGQWKSGKKLLLPMAELMTLLKPQNLDLP